MRYLPYKNLSLNYLSVTFYLKVTYKIVPKKLRRKSVSMIRITNLNKG